MRDKNNTMLFAVIFITENNSTKCISKNVNTFILGIIWFNVIMSNLLYVNMYRRKTDDVKTESDALKMQKRQKTVQRDVSNKQVSNDNII